jgi:hypothetical protein
MLIVKVKKLEMSCVLVCALCAGLPTNSETENLREQVVFNMD